MLKPKECVMRKIKDYENKMVHNGKRNERFILIPCDHCGEKVWKKWHSRIKRSDPQYCDKKCFDDWQREKSERECGKENARFYWDGRCWVAHWYEGGKQKNTTKAKWLWEQNCGAVPNGYVVTYIDGNPENCELDNLHLMTRGDRTSIALMGHKHSDETRKKISLAHTGKSKWEGFVSKRAYPGLSKRRKSEVKERDSFTCQVCGEYLKGSSRAIVHHIDGDKTNQNMNNLILVCRKCHALIHCNKSVPDKILAFRSMLKY